jgi:hypothetical protein
MLTEAQANRVWQKMYEAEVRSFYFGDLASRYTRRKQQITFLSFFLASGAAATVAAESNHWWSIAMSSAAAVLMAYSIAVGLDRKAAVMAKLHYSWNRLAADYERLWNHWHEDNAEVQLEEILNRAREVSEMGTEAPYDEQLIEKWQDRVNAQYGVATPA